MEFLPITLELTTANDVPFLVRVPSCMLEVVSSLTILLEDFLTVESLLIAR